MKLRVYTSKETDDLISNIKLVSNYIVDINTDAINLFDSKYKEYLDAFKPGLLFKRKPLTRKKFINKCFWNEGTKTVMYDPEESYISSFLLFKENFTDSFEYCDFQPNLKFYDDHFTKYGINGWNEEDKKVLNCAAGSTNYIFNLYHFREWYTILIKYAHRPFEFDKDDIKSIEYIERNVELAKKYYEDKNAV
jgi:hypothetical protein